MLIKFSIKEYIEDRSLENLSRRTLESYENTLTEFRLWLNGCNGNEEEASSRSITHIGDITSQHVKGYMKYCYQERQNSHTTVAGKLTNLKVYFNYLTNEGLIDERDNPILRVKNPQKDTSVETLTEEQVRLMLRHLRRRRRVDDFYHYRDYTLVVFLLGTGARLGEIMDLRWKDIDLKEGQVVFPATGKARTQQGQPLGAKLVNELKEYKQYLENDTHGLPAYLFTTRTGRKLSREAIKLVFVRLAQELKFEYGRVSAHSLRHFYCSSLIKAGVSPFVVQKLMRHSKIETTMKYVTLWGQSLQEGNEKGNPLNNLNI
ncbi:tyrosine-type recombinase/integrase [Bacillus thuringiensis]|uniref:tyrosine-type recombinase/integrase n=1 Tax=Bacillus thuringiensis TaxID=1428 RepID=UPI002E1DFA68|nr:tyrosine-type recombinase/integrase [Bacillus thuringiensis]MED3635308.1 tyrosine-type recombinase/integrase [Bacillus thuringiensis]